MVTNTVVKSFSGDRVSEIMKMNRKKLKNGQGGMENNEQLKQFPVVYRKKNNVVISFKT